MYQLYSQKKIVTNKTFSRFFPLILLCFQLFELVCYLVLFRYISQHNKEMAENNIISTDLVSNRRRINIFSLYAQICGFITEAVYLNSAWITRLLERRQMITHTREYANVGLIVLFSINPTVQIFASSELRKKILRNFSTIILTNLDFLFAFKPHF